MQNKWRTCQLGDIITFQRGHDLPKAQMKSGQYPVVGSNGIIGYHNEYTTDAPSITVGRSGNTGKPFIFYGRSWSHNTTLYVKEYKNSDPVFIFYLLQTLDLNNYAGGSAVPTLNRNHVHIIEVNVPPLTEQVEIGRTLRSIDDKIANNTRINHHLLSPRSATDSSPDIRRGKSVSRSSARRRHSMRLFTICSYSGARTVPNRRYSSASGIRTSAFSNASRFICPMVVALSSAIATKRAR